MAKLPFYALSLLVSLLSTKYLKFSEGMEVLVLVLYTELIKDDIVDRICSKLTHYSIAFSGVDVVEEALYLQTPLPTNHIGNHRANE